MTDPAVALEDMRKYSLAAQLIGSVDLIVSTQVVTEVCSVLAREAAFTEIQTKQIIQDFYDSCSVVALNVKIRSDCCQCLVCQCNCSVL